MLLQLDGSPHAWLGDQAPRCTVLGAIDDATGEVVAALFRNQEDAHGYFLLLRTILSPESSLRPHRGHARGRLPGSPWHLPARSPGPLDARRGTGRTPGTNP